MPFDSDQPKDGDGEPSFVDFHFKGETDPYTVGVCCAFHFMGFVKDLFTRGGTVTIRGGKPEFISLENIDRLVVRGEIKDKVYEELNKVLEEIKRDTAALKRVFFTPVN